ncbi:MAG: hypothetical protein P4L53_04060 [Candidatus Obscuribacterales bacterium]|nr:hypothetical protein [Candidatus Obscuribacterales bacterium]
MTATLEKIQKLPKVQTKSPLQSRALAALVAFVAANSLAAAVLGPADSALDSHSLSETNYTSPMYGTWTWWMARGFVKISASKHPDIAVMGSSQVNSPSWAADAHLLRKSIDCLDHREIYALEQGLSNEGKMPTVVNCAVQGGMISDYYMIEKSLFQKAAQTPKLVIVCVSPRDFIDNKLPAASSTEPFRFFSRFVDSGRLSALAYPDWRERCFAFLDNTINQLPLKRLNDVWTARLTRAMTSLTSCGDGKANGGMTLQKEPDAFAKPAQTSNMLAQAISNGQLQVKLGEWVVPPNMEHVFVDNTAEYQRRYAVAKPVSYAIQLSFFKEMLTDLRNRGCDVIVVQMPTLPMNQVLLPETFWQDFKQTLANLCVENKASMLDLTQDKDFQKSDYLDTVHLNDHGGIKLFEKLSRAVRDDSQLHLD